MEICRAYLLLNELTAIRSRYTPALPAGPLIISVCDWFHGHQIYFSNCRVSGLVRATQLRSKDESEINKQIFCQACQSTCTTPIYYGTQQSPKKTLMYMTLKYACEKDSIICTYLKGSGVLINPLVSANSGMDIPNMFLPGTIDTKLWVSKTINQ